MKENNFTPLIRKAEERDLPAVIYINRSELPENYPYSFFEYVLRNNPTLFYVADVNGKIVGYVMAQLEEGGRYILLTSMPEIFKEGKVVHLLSIAVLKDYQGRGIGSLLLQRIIESARKLGARRIYLEVRVSNERAQRLYKKFGFRVFARLSTYYMDGEDAYLMVKDL